MYLEFGTDRDGRPWCWEYNLRRGVSKKKKEPNDIIYKKIEDLRISDTGDFVFEPEAYHRRATPHELGLLWDKKLADRIPVQKVYSARPEHLRAGKSLKQCNEDAGRPDPAKPERGALQGVRSSSGSSRDGHDARGECLFCVLCPSSVDLS